MDSQRLSHATQRDDASSNSNDAPPVQGPMRARPQVQIRRGDEVVTRLGTLMSALETAGHDAGTVIVERGVTVATWELRCVSPSGKRVGHWVLVGIQSQKTA